MPKIRLTELIVKKLPLRESEGQTEFFDDSLPGFAVVVGRKRKTYIVHTDIAGKSAKLTIGGAHIMSLEVARTRARSLLCDIRNGIDPRVQKKIAADKVFSVSAAFTEYLESKKLADTTVRDMKEVTTLYISDWCSMSVHEITPSMISARHKRIGKDSGEPTANRVMRYLRAVLNWCRVFHGLKENPVESLSLSRSWYRVQPKTTKLKLYDMRTWYAAAKLDPDHDFLFWLLFTGMRRGESLKMLWSSIDMTDRTFIVIDPKNHRDLHLPLSDPLFNMLEKRRKAMPDEEFLFPGTGKSGHKEEPKKSVARIEAITGLKINFHDLRRTYVTIAESLDIPHYCLKALLNHSSGKSNDVTQNYIQISPERLRRPVQKIARFISGKIGIPNM